MTFQFLNYFSFLTDNSETWSLFDYSKREKRQHILLKSIFPKSSAQIKKWLLMVFAYDRNIVKSPNQEWHIILHNWKALDIQMK